MKNPLAIMTAIIRKLRRKRKLSSELHSRWGDVSITYPTEGSWSQWDQPSSINMNVAAELVIREQQNVGPGTLLPALLNRIGKLEGQEIMESVKLQIE